MKRARIVVKRKEACFLCHESALCANDRLEKELGVRDVDLDRWYCEKCWKREMKKRRRHNTRLPADSPARLSVLPWPRHAQQPLQYESDERGIFFPAERLSRIEGAQDIFGKK